MGKDFKLKFDQAEPDPRRPDERQPMYTVKAFIRNRATIDELLELGNLIDDVLARINKEDAERGTN